MAKITRYTGNLKAPASNASVGKRGTFGDPTGAADDSLNSNLNTQLLQGWEFVGPSEYPTLQDFNSMGFTLGQIHAYLHQVGVPEWAPLQEYYVGSITNVGGVLYRCLVDNVGTNPVGDLTGVWEFGNKSVGSSGQIYINLTGSRLEGVIYTNTTGKSIYVSITMVGTSAVQTALLRIGSIDVSKFATNSGTSGFQYTLNAVVPAGETYEVAAVSGATIQTWAELR